MSNEQFGHANKLGDCNTLGHANKLGDCNTLGDWNKLGDGNKLGHRNTLGHFNTLGNNNTFGRFSTFGDNNKLGHDNSLGHHNTLGNNNTLGHDNSFGNFNSFGDSFKHGKRLTSEGVKVIRLMCMSNVDGSGRRIIIYIHTEGILIRAGCFKGSLDEFCAKAESEGKKRYSRVVRAAAEALAADVAEEGFTNGWGE